ncbi:inter-alpha-trypsin inhibitor heavy chain H4-like isoform X1 [Diabrotica undecimpunctata]|uniref:inter-alpha-trypsin inhibitor heavy chain H4-like isoform X1 n=1 Tax=Diabrotica undecimpunctata TaxID=50387 RepID=UPI003B640733
MKGILFALVASVCLGWAFCIPGLVVRGIRSAKEVQNDQKAQSEDPIISEFNIHSNISNRFAKTLVTSKVKNSEKNPKEATFTVVLPEKAFISKFVMEIGGKSYEAYVREKEEAKNIYDSAVRQGISAGHVSVSARDSNRFTVSINVEPESKATFHLTYEELLERKNNQYELVLNIHPGQVVKDMNIEVFVNESRPLKFVKTPSLRSGNEISKNDANLDPSADIKIINSTSAVVKFNPNVDKQREFAKELGQKENEGIAGQFVVQYDVDRDSQKGEILLKDGYFVHFFAPEDVEPLPKHVVFILDTSGSMYGRKLRQVKEAMGSILDQLKDTDSFHIVEFNSDIFVWNIDSESKSTLTVHNEREPFEELFKLELPNAVAATKEAISKGKAVIDKLQDTGLTNMLGSIETGLHLVNKELRTGSKRQPLIIFLTDGDPTMGISNTEEITKIVTKINGDKDHVPIFSLSFGDGADKNFLRKLSLKNLGFARHIYEGADAAIQLQEFYKQISSPLLSNIEFEYTDDVTEVSKKTFPIYFKGSELVVTGRYPIDEGFDISNWRVKSRSRQGLISLPPVREAPVGELERLWAYLTIKQKLEQRELADNKTQLTKEALDLALKYSFVTDVSSLVVVKPNQTSAVDTEDASKPKYDKFSRTFSSPHQSMSVSYAMPGIPGPPAPFAPRTYLDPQPRYGGSAYVPLGLSGQKGSYGGFALSSAVDQDDDDTDDSFLVRGPNRAWRPTWRPTVIYTSTTPPTTSSKPAIKDLLPWLKNITNQNGTLNILGGAYDLGEGQFVLSNGECTKTPNKNFPKGTCSLLSNCPHVHLYLTDFLTYEQFACILDNKYAGVCCPEVVQMP